jgi:hypothetical protein
MAVWSQGPKQHPEIGIDQFPGAVKFRISLEAVLPTFCGGAVLAR